MSIYKLHIMVYDFMPEQPVITCRRVIYTDCFDFLAGSKGIVTVLDIVSVNIQVIAVSP